MAFAHLVTERLRLRPVMAEDPSPGDTFEHPLVPEGDPLRLHVVYRLSRQAQ